MLRLSIVVSLLCSLALGPLAHAQPVVPSEVRVSEHTLHVGAATTTIDCAPQRAARVADRILVVCADHRIHVFAWTADGQLASVEDRLAPGPVLSTFEVEGAPWILSSEGAVALSALPIAAPPEPAPPPPPPPPPPPTIAVAPSVPSRSEPVATPELPEESATRLDTLERRTPSQPSGLAGTVLEVHGSRVLISIGRDAGVREDDRVEIALPHSSDDLDVRRIVGRVVGLAGTRAEIEVGFGEIVPIGAAIRTTTSATTRVLTDPTPHRDFVSLTTGARAWIDAAGIGTLDELALTYRADIPLAIRARVWPFAALYVGPTTDQPADGGGVVGGGSLDAMFDDRYFALGVGIGFGSYVSSRIVHAAPGITPDDRQRVGFALLPSLRVGTVDGLHFAVQFSALSVIDEFRFGGFTLDTQIPLVPGFWLTPRGSYTISGMGFADLGLRIAVDGNGGPGTLFVVPSLGWAGMDTGNHGFRSGPTVGITLETRFGV